MARSSRLWLEPLEARNLPSASGPLDLATVLALSSGSATVGEEGLILV